MKAAASASLAAIRPVTVVMGALAVVNAVGDVRAADGTIIAGTRRDNAFVDSAALLRANVTAGVGITEGVFSQPPAAIRRWSPSSTNARLDKLGLTRLALQAHDGLALAISPVHTAYDGDTVFALSTGEEEVDPISLAALAVELVAQAIRRAVLAAVAPVVCLLSVILRAFPLDPL